MSLLHGTWLQGTPGPDPLLVAVLAFFALERGVEVLIHRRNSVKLHAAGAVWVERDGFLWILAAQAVLFGGLAIEGALAPWTGPHAATWALLALLLLLQGLRYWVIATLGWRWSVRVVTVPGAPRITRGPYGWSWMRHPNYLVVGLESVVLPLAFGAWVTLLVAAPLQLAALVRRIRLEERALSAAAPDARGP